ncbi:MAG: hypothetical protein M3Q85_15645 [Acidobacteriota bacterium]|nr:hypothetical protein [Acidobacteriota bacterium]
MDGSSKEPSTGVRRDNTEPVSTGEDGRVVLEMLNAAYYSARTGRKVPLPFRPTVSRPIDLWPGSDRVSSSPD